MPGSGDLPERDLPEDGAPRRLWRGFEPVHAVTYFAPECRDGLRAIGFRGFWMGYFAARAAPLGQVGSGWSPPSSSTSTRPWCAESIPDAWEIADRTRGAPGPPVGCCRRPPSGAAHRRRSCGRTGPPAAPGGRERRWVGSGVVQRQSRPGCARRSGRGAVAVLHRRSASTAGTAMWWRSPPPASTAVRPLPCLPHRRTCRQRCSVRIAGGQPVSGKMPVTGSVTEA